MLSPPASVTSPSSCFLQLGHDEVNKLLVALLDQILVSEQGTVLPDKTRDLISKARLAITDKWYAKGRYSRYKMERLFKKLSHRFTSLPWEGTSIHESKALNVARLALVDARLLAPDAEFDERFPDRGAHLTLTMSAIRDFEYHMNNFEFPISVLNTSHDPRVAHFAMKALLNNTARSFQQALDQAASLVHKIDA